MSGDNHLFWWKRLENVRLLFLTVSFIACSINGDMFQHQRQYKESCEDNLRCQFHFDDGLDCNTLDVMSVWKRMLYLPLVCLFVFLCVYRWKEGGGTIHPSHNLSLTRVAGTRSFGLSLTPSLVCTSRKGLVFVKNEWHHF